MNETLKPGDRVRLISGGPVMTVRSLAHGGLTANQITATQIIVTTDWIGDNGAPYRSDYVTGQLEAYQGAPK